jgi:hypothetical protein
VTTATKAELGKSKSPNQAKAHLKRSREITPDPKYEATPVDGKLFDMWLVDLITGKLHKVENRLAFDDAIAWQREWMKQDQACSPIIVRCGYEMPSELRKSQPDPPETPSSDHPAESVSLAKRRPRKKARRITNLIS